MPRPRKKPEYNSEEMAKQIIDEIVDAYLNSTVGLNEKGNMKIRTLAEEFMMTPLKIRKILITAGVFHTEICDRVNELHQSGMSVPEIQKLTGLSRASVQSYLPYKKIIYKMDEISVLAERLRKYRNRKQAVIRLKEGIDNGDVGCHVLLWNTLLLFAEYPFQDQRGKRFYYKSQEESIVIGHSNIERHESFYGCDARELRTYGADRISALDAVVLQETLTQAYELMTKRQKEVVQYYYIEGMGVQEIADIYGISHQAVSVTLADVKKKFRKNKKIFE